MAKSKKTGAPASSKVDDPRVAEWVARAPEIRGLRRPGTRMKAISLMQRMEAKGVFAGTKEMSDDAFDGVAEFIADIDELLGVLGGTEYTQFIEEVPFEDGVQMAVLLEIFASKIAPNLGKGSTSPA